MLRATVAGAQGAVEPERATPEPSATAPSATAPSATAPAATAPAAAESPAPEAERKREVKAMAGLDVVLGWGRVPFALQNAPASGQPYVTYSRSDGVTSNVQSLMLVGSMELFEHVGIGARLPLTFAGFSPNGSAERSTESFGNLELEGEYTRHIAHKMHLVGSLGLALPTAQGSEIPPDLNQTPAGQVDSTLYDRFSLSRAAAAARGFEDNALFEPNRLGIIPKVALVVRLHGWTIEPYVKVENLIGTSTQLAAPYVGEFVGAARVGYWVQHRFELAVKGVVNAGFAGTSEDKRIAVALEPSAILRFGPVRPYAGVIIPLAGQPSENGFLGVHFGVAAAL